MDKVFHSLGSMKYFCLYLTCFASNCPATVHHGYWTKFYVIYFNTCEVFHKRPKVPGARMDNDEGWKTRRMSGHCLLHQQAFASKGMKPDPHFVQNTAVNADHFVKLKVNLEPTCDGKCPKVIETGEKHACTHPKICLPQSHTLYRGSVSLTQMCMHIHMLGIDCHAPNSSPVIE